MAYEGNEEGWPATASPHAGLAANGQVMAKAPNKGGRPTTVGPTRKGGQRRPQGAATTRSSVARGHNRLQHGTRGQPCR
ncbi:hypothetical protein B296_00038593 [Ensete ventricosum]|uniref:Uncharacterized protein n=1 Tax=Ensete ventricosum TaxID=4639 RepID=A0A426X209_ENSVE|nr:hypothetical protein B296_00038593 [Ensete ventricosum]